MSRAHAVRVGLTLVVLVACKDGSDAGKDTDPTGETDVEQLADVCDAGEEAWVHRAMLMVWGRRPHGVVEARLWADLSARHGRAEALRAMMQAPPYREWMTQWLLDALAVDRSGDRVFPTCYHQQELTPSADLALFLRDHEPHGSDFGRSFSMADVIASALLLDDVSVVYRSHLLARMARVPTNANTSEYDSDYEFRASFGASFMDVYLNRDLGCLPCHNSEFSVTGSSDPALDRTWEIPGHWEKALFGRSVGRPAIEIDSMFRYHDLIVWPETKVQPWGISTSCISLAPPGTVDDFVGEQAFFIQDYGTWGTVWELEAHLREGVAGLREGLPEVGADGAVEPDTAFAYLVAASLADRVWELGMGSRLTISHRLPRNKEQRDRLSHLTASILTSGWSLQRALTEVATDPTFNPAAPAECEGELRMPALFDPFSVDLPDEAARYNTAGDRVVRVPPRAALRSIHDAMGWTQPPDFYPWTTRVVAPSVFHHQFGVYQFDATPTVDRSVPFEVMLAFQHAYGRCEPPDDLFVTDAPECGFLDPSTGSNPYGACDACVCALQPECCRGAWDESCATLCNGTCGGCGADEVLLDTAEDVIVQLTRAAAASGGTVGDVVVALRDRLLGSSVMSSTERSLVEELLERPLDAPAEASLAADEGLRLLCGAMLSSPQSMLLVTPALGGAVPVIDLSSAEDCARAESAAAAAGLTWSCP